MARLFALHVLLHSIISVVYYRQDGAYASSLVKAWWVWGCVGTVAMCAMLITATLWVRRSSYEFFLVSHIVLAILMLVGTWYHLDDLYMNMSGYEQWLYVAFGVWALDRLFRILRVLRNGVKRAHMTEIGGGIVRVDIPDIHWGFHPGKVVNTYFPTLHRLRPWENHPFSVLPTAMLARSRIAEHNSKRAICSGRASTSQEDVEKSFPERRAVMMAQPHCGEADYKHPVTAGLTLFIRKSTGLTKVLASRCDVLTLLDGPYPGNSTTHILQCERVLLVCGGIGITAVLPWIDHHPNVKLAWSIKQSAAPLKDAVGDVLARVIEKDVRMGQRLDVKDLIAKEVQAGWSRVGVVACGPRGMCDDVRATVAATARHGNTAFELEVHGYSW